MGNKVFTFGDIRIREVKGKYYVYIIEKDNEGNRRDNYIGPLDNVKIGLGVFRGNTPNTVGPAGFEPAITRAQAWHPSPG